MRVGDFWRVVTLDDDKIESLGAGDDVEQLVNIVDKVKQRFQRTRPVVVKVWTITMKTSGLAVRSAFVVQQPLPAALRDEALAQVLADLQRQGLVDNAGNVSKDAHARLDWSRELSLPTPGVVVKACLDDCDACEPELERSYKLDNDRRELENQLLARQIDLLDKAQEYRCCPGGDAPSPDE